MIRKEKINVYDQDVKLFGSYVYNRKDSFSSNLARKREFDEILNIFKIYFKKNISILDVGSGDGSYALELFNSIQPKFLLGFDFSKQGVEVSSKKINRNQKDKIKFVQLNINDISKHIKKNEFDVALLSGVLHHLHAADVAIDKLSEIVDKVIVIEPNGFNPALKIIEKISPYHRKHKEKSYWPPHLDKWFDNAGYNIVNKKYFGLVPYFCNERIAKLLKFFEPLIERIPLLNYICCGRCVIYYSK